jgi:hypothetical protein
MSLRWWEREEEEAKEIRSWVWGASRWRWGSKTETSENVEKRRESETLGMPSENFAAAAKGSRSVLKTDCG